MKKPRLQLLIRNFIIELAVYAALLVGYFFLVLRFLNDFLTDLFHNQTVAYAVIGLGLIFAQAVLLESLTSYLIKLLRLDRFG